jgi:hypothetical protein
MCAVLFACAAPGTSGSSGQIVDRVQIMGSPDPNEVNIRNAGPSSANALLQFPAARVWALVPAAYSVLSIPIIAVDTVGRAITGQVLARRTFADRPLRTFVDCGSSITGANANTYSVTIKLNTFVDVTAAESSRLRTLVEATGISGAGAQVRCSSTGDLELMILNRIQEGLAQ